MTNQAIQKKQYSPANASANNSIQAYAEKNEIPAEGVTVLGGNPYINFTGLIHKAKSLGLKSVEIEMLEEATPAKLSARVKATVILKDDSKYEDFGYGSKESIKMSTLHNADFINMTTITRAKNRALRSATGVGLVSAEEMENQPNCKTTQEDNATKLLNKNKDEKKEEKTKEETKVVEAEIVKEQTVGKIDGEGDKIKKMVAEYGSDLEKVLKFYTVDKVEDLTVTQASELCNLLRKKKEQKIKPKEVKKESPKPKQESAAAKAMRTGKENAKVLPKVEPQKEIKGVPEDVCEYLNAIKDIPDADVPSDIVMLRLDTNRGDFKGAMAYPSLADEMIKTIKAEEVKSTQEVFDVTMDILEVVNELSSHDPKELSDDEKRLIEDCGNNKFLGKEAYNIKF